jgi:hypothetical protein
MVLRARSIITERGLRKFYGLASEGLAMAVTSSR